MKKPGLFIFILLISFKLLFSQVAINADGSSPNNSALLDVKSNNKGFLPPRMTLAEMNAIPKPMDGLIIYCTDCLTNTRGAIAIFIDGNWNALNVNCYPPMTPIIQPQIPSSTGITWDWKGVPYATGYKWNYFNNYSTAIYMDTVTTKTETGFACNTAYTRYVWAYNDCGASLPLTLSQTTLACSAPIISTTTVSAIASTTATSGGNITSDGGSAVTARGVCWSTFQNPTIVNSKTRDGIGTGTFTSLITGLVPGTTYYIKAYATNTNGTSYGTQLSFTTTASAFPEVVCYYAFDIITNSLSFSNEVINDGGSSVTARGLCYSTSQNPTILNSKTLDGSGIGTFTSVLTGLTHGTTYFVKAYATNSKGTGYSPQAIATTTPDPPTVITKVISGITITGAITGGEITDNGGMPVTERGVCWSTNQHPTIADPKTSDGNGNGTFISTLAGLQPNTTYFLRAYATNYPNVTGYGNEDSFTTKSDIPTVSTTAISNITAATATSGGNVTDDGGSPIMARGVCWNVNPNPTVLNSKTNNGAGPGIYASSLTGLAAGSTYYVRAYATNSGKTGYGNPVAFQTPAFATISTTTVTNISYATAISGGFIISDNGSPVTSRGVCWSTLENPTTADSKTVDGTGAGSYLSSLTGLFSGQQYFVRAYAINAAGTSYGDQKSFTTLVGVPDAVDADGNHYTPVVIGTQTWMTSNLKTTRYRNGEAIENIILPNNWINASSGAYCWYNNDITRKEKMGALYNFYAVTDPRNIAPVGWHVATDADWATLRAFLGNKLKDGYQLMASGPNDWLPSYGTNSTSFTAYPAGYRYFSDGMFYDSDTNENAGIQTYFWTTTILNLNNKQSLGWFLFDGQINPGSYDFNYGFSVRCVKD